MPTYSTADTFIILFWSYNNSPMRGPYIFVIFKNLDIVSQARAFRGKNIRALCAQSHEKSIGSLLLGNFGIGIGVHPSILQIKKKIDAKLCHLPYR